MMLSEAHSKAILVDAAVAVPAGAEVGTRVALRSLDIAYPVALKAQVASGGRGKAGGIRRCESPSEAEESFDAIMRMSFAGERPRSVLVEPWLAISRELYLSVTVDGSAGGYLVIYAPAGGMEIESGPPPLRYPVGLPESFRSHRFRRRLTAVEPDPAVRERVVALARRLLGIARARDCLTIEINPLVVLESGALVAADAKVVLDDAAAFRSALIANAQAEARRAAPDDARLAEEAGLMYVALDGDIGIISGGAGMTMAAMDTIEAAGGGAACFLDVSGAPNAGGFNAAFAILDGNPRVRGILVSMFGGGLQTDRVARTLNTVLDARASRKPVIIRLNGTRSDVAGDVLRAAGRENHATLEEAVQRIVAAVGRSG